MCHSHHSRSESHSETIGHGETRTFGHSRSVGVNSGISTTDGEHSCTAQCARIHLSEKIQTLEKELRELAKTLPVRDWQWYRTRVETAFDEILLQGLD